MSDQTNTTTNNDSGGIFGIPLNTSSNTNNSAVQNQQDDQSGMGQSTIPANPVVDSDENLSSQNQSNPIVQSPDPIQNQNSEEDTFAKMGLDVVDENDQAKPSNIFSPDSKFREKEQSEIGAQTQTSEPAPVLQNTQKQTENTSDDVDTQELEKDFSNTFSDSHSKEAVLPEISLDSEEEKLRTIHAKLIDKASLEKRAIKEELEKLKQQKEAIGARLEAVKELEEVAAKIQEKLQNLEQIDSDLDSIEQQAKSKLS